MSGRSSETVNGEGGLRIRNAEIDGDLTNVVIVGERVASIERAPGSGAPCSEGLSVAHEELDAEGGALLPGLHDHHVHLLSQGARGHSVDLNSCQFDGLQAGERLAVLRSMDEGVTDRWMRVVNYHESMGHADRDSLDRLLPHRPVRVQHRSGALWILNSRAIETIGLESSEMAGVERDSQGRVTGRLFGLDQWLTDQVGIEPVDLFAVAAMLHQFGVTGVTDLTPVATWAQIAPIAEAARSGLALRVSVSPSPELEVTADQIGPLSVGPVKVYLADHNLPTLGEVRSLFLAAHSAGRVVAVHSVSRVSLALSLAAWHDVGAQPGDRLEHGSLIPVEAMPDLAGLGVTVVTQPNFVFERGDDYLADVSPRDEVDLYRCRSLLNAGINVSIGTDFPFGSPDPWLAMSAATNRQTRSGATIGIGEAISGESALSMLLAAPSAPGGTERRVAIGAVADLCLLDRPRTAAVTAPSSAYVRATLVGGEVVMSKG